ncbi:hypothetical protein ACFMJ1_26105, partial [Acinetobacter baumannii]
FTADLLARHAQGPRVDGQTGGRIIKATLCPEKRLKLRKKTRAVLEWNRISKATLCPEKRLKLRKKTRTKFELRG